MRIDFLFMPWGRVGSNLLLDIVSQSGVFDVHNEPFTGIRSRNRGDDTAALVEQRQELDKLAANSDVRRQFCNLSMQSIVDIKWFRGAIAPNTGAFIYLSRRNTVKTALSVIKAENYAEWHKREFGSAVWAVSDPTRVRADKMRVDVGRLLKLCDRLRASHQTMAELREKTGGLVIWYEDIQTDLHGVVSEVCACVDIPMFDYKVRHFKAVSDDLDKEVSNIDELRAGVLAYDQKWGWMLS